jgi:hypothetical protein
VGGVARRGGCVAAAAGPRTWRGVGHGGGGRWEGGCRWLRGGGPGGLGGEAAAGRVLLPHSTLQRQLWHTVLVCYQHLLSSKIRKYATDITWTDESTGVLPSELCPS